VSKLEEKPVRQLQNNLVMAEINRLKRRTRLRKSIRSKVSGTAERPRLSVYRSNKAIYAQVINDVEGKTLASFSSVKLDDKKGTKTEVAKKVGLELAKAAKEAGIESVVFDRGGYLFHGRVAALAAGAKEGGLKF
jgi:large subunit ribosomal protein L18